MRGLPPEALLNTKPEDRTQDRWGLQTELLAQMLEVMSVVATEKRLKDVIKVPRPEHLKRRRKAATPDEATKRGIAILAATSKGLR